MPAPRRERVPSEPRRRRASLGKVLVVDDEPLMRLFVVRALEGAGYDTLDAESAEQALGMLERDPASIGLLLSDVRLPGASGPELCEEAKAIVPELPTLLMSGTVKPLLVSEMLVARDAEVLQKPFRIAELLAKLEAVLGRPPENAPTLRQ